MHGELGPLFRLVRDRRVAFLIVGGINTLMGTLWFVLFQSLLGQRFGQYTYLLSLLCAHVCAVLTAFVLYRRFVFRVRGHVWLDLWRFELVNLSALGINAIALPFVVQVVGLEPIPAQLLVTCVTALITYFGHRDFSFRRKRVRETGPAVHEPVVGPVVRTPPVVPGDAPGAPADAPGSASRREGVA
jgi:putative flippase GtrA